jgi:hypothetical protein
MFSPARTRLLAALSGGMMWSWPASASPPHAYVCIYPINLQVTCLTVVLAEFGSIDPAAADATTEESWGPARPTNSMTEKITMI